MHHSSRRVGCITCYLSSPILSFMATDSRDQLHTLCFLAFSLLRSCIFCCRDVGSYRSVVKKKSIAELCSKGMAFSAMRNEHIAVCLTLNALGKCFVLYSSSKTCSCQKANFHLLKFVLSHS